MVSTIEQQIHLTAADLAMEGSTDLARAGSLAQAQNDRIVGGKTWSSPHLFEEPPLRLRTTDLNSPVGRITIKTWMTCELGLFLEVRGHVDHLQT